MHALINKGIQRRGTAKSVVHALSCWKYDEYVTGIFLSEKMYLYLIYNHNHTDCTIEPSSLDIVLFTMYKKDTYSENYLFFIL